MKPHPNRHSIDRLVNLLGDTRLHVSPRSEGADVVVSTRPTEDQLERIAATLGIDTWSLEHGISGYSIAILNQRTGQLRWLNGHEVNAQPLLDWCALHYRVLFIGAKATAAANKAADAVRRAAWAAMEEVDKAAG